MRKRRGKIFARTKLVLAGTILIAMLLAVIGWQEIKTYEHSILAVYAEQQDAYVQLVLDQINVLENRSDEEIVTKILSSLDTSGRKYWTLTKDRSLLFVKDVTETNRYRGLSTESFFVGKSASTFLKNLMLNQVSHEMIEIDQEKYVASGVIFQYNGAEYTICLLTNETVVLDHNTVLSSKIGMYIFIYGILGVFLVAVLFGADLLQRRDAEIKKLQAHTRALNRVVEEQTEKIKAMDYYHSRWCLYQIRLMDVFVKKLAARGVYPVTFLALAFENQKKRREFLEKAQILLDEKALRFDAGDGRIYLAFVQYGREEAERALDYIPHAETLFRIERAETCAQDGQNLWEVYRTFRQAADQREEETS